MAIVFKYYVGKLGPQIYHSENGELPFRVERLTDEDINKEGDLKDVALNISSGVLGTGGTNISDTVSGTDYAVFRGIHFNAFNLAGDLL